jgi:hypothetical protein
VGIFRQPQMSIVRLGMSDACAIFSLAVKVDSWIERDLNQIREFLSYSDSKALNLSIGIYRKKKLVGYLLAVKQENNNIINSKNFPNNIWGATYLKNSIFVMDIAFENNNRLLAIRLLRNFLKLTRLFPTNDHSPVYIYLAIKKNRELYVERLFIKKSVILLKSKKLIKNKNDNMMFLFCFEISFPQPTAEKPLFQKLKCKQKFVNNSNFVVGVLKTYRAMEIIRPYWNLLLNKTSAAIGLQEYNFLKYWYINIGWPCKLYFIVVMYENSPIAIAPFQINKFNILKKNIKRLAFLGLNKELDRQTIFCEHNLDDIIKSIVKFLVFNKKDWDQVALFEQKRESFFAGKFNEYMKKAGFLIGNTNRPECPYVEINGTWDGFLNSKSRQFRKSIRRKIDALKKKGELSFDFVWPLEANAFLDRYLQVEAQSWKSSAGMGIRKTSGHLAFYRDIANFYAQKGLFKFGFLYLNKVPIAGTFGVGWRQSFYSLQICHDEKFFKESPGFVLTAFELENMFEDGRFSIFDFLGGALHNKLSWSTNSDGTENIFVNHFNVFGVFYHFIVFAVKPLLIKLKIIKSGI